MSVLYTCSLQLAVNYIPIQQQTGGVYQYVVGFAPDVESRGVRAAMVNEHTDVIGTTKAFDGAQLFLPIRLPQVVSVGVGVGVAVQLNFREFLYIVVSVNPKPYLDLIP